VLHAGPRPDLAPISSDQPPINKLEVTEDNVAYVDASDSPCLRGVEEVPGNLIIWDNGELQDLAVLSALKKVGCCCCCHSSAGVADAGGFHCCSSCGCACLRQLHPRPC
jgi:hypothetical protein